MVLGYALISLLPITDPDSLDYHLPVPYLSLLNKSFFIQNEWFTSQLTGAGEALIIFGLSINAYKLSSILQFSLISTNGSICIFFLRTEESLINV